MLLIPLFLYHGSATRFEKPRMYEVSDVVCDWVSSEEHGQKAYWGLGQSTEVFHN